MPAVFDSSDGNPQDHAGRLTKFFEDCDSPTQIRYVAGAEQTWTRLKARQLGGTQVFHLESRGMRVVRTPHELRRTTSPDAVCANLMVRGHGWETTNGGTRRRGAGRVFVGDQTVPNEFAWASEIEMVVVTVPFDRLGLPASGVRTALGKVDESPVLDLLANHLSRVWQAADALTPPTAAILADATTELVRATITSVGRDRRQHKDAWHETLYEQTIAFVHQHLAERDLSAERIASALGISVRHLYTVWSVNEISLAQWIIAQRLEACRRQLARHDPSEPTMAAIAHRWGFADPTHFSRRFREAYGTSPMAWREQHRAGRAAALPLPRSRLGSSRT